MKRLITLIFIMTIAYPAASWAVAGVGFGASVGFASYSGDILPSSGDLGEGVQYGAVIEITAFPVIDLELHANYFTKSFSYTYDVGGVPLGTDFEFRDVSVKALAKKNIFPIPASPLKLYVGAGIGYHMMNTELALGALGNPNLADDPFTLLSNTGRTSIEGMFGLKIAPPVVPLAVYGQYRFGRILTENVLTTKEIEAGLMFKF
jgi:hypothetical protein